ncbi:putative nuclease HARBI1 isoform X2 [Pieris napi]|uniref:putative nuclease HARBI1 isoform X2 n=1 Tax=Pieris napi TaxID=78633 RepID=UPI001FB962B9|nr:putative nuclease HARBI1 isoform X2 [Pieris napi]
MESILFNTFHGSFFEEENEAQVLVRKRKVFKKRIYNFNLFDENEFIDRFRVSKEVAIYITDSIKNEITSNTDKNLAVKPIDQVLVTLQYYASGSFMRCVGDMSGLHKSTVCRIIRRVTLAISKLRPQFIYMPRTDQEKEEMATKFYNVARFPKVLGAIDCSHINILSPGGDNAEDFRNRKGLFSFNVQVIGDADLYIRNIVARWPGSAHDSHIFNSSNIKYRIESGEFDGLWLLGDSGYALKSYLLTPLADPQTEAEKLYNESHIRTRNSIERLFGVWKRRFPIVGSKIRCKIDNIQPIIVATAVLHNICRAHNVKQPTDFVNLDQEVTSLPTQPENSVSSEFNIRDGLINNYFARL